MAAGSLRDMVVGATAQIGVAFLATAFFTVEANAVERTMRVSPLFEHIAARSDDEVTITEICRYRLRNDPIATRCTEKGPPTRPCLKVVEGREELLVRCHVGRDTRDLCGSAIPGSEEGKARGTSVVFRTRAWEVAAATREMRLSASIGLVDLAGEIASRDGVEYVEPNCYYQVLYPDPDEKPGARTDSAGADGAGRIESGRGETGTSGSVAVSRETATVRELERREFDSQESPSGVPDGTGPHHVRAHPDLDDYLTANLGGADTIGAGTLCDGAPAGPARSEFDDPVFRAGRQWALEAMSAQSAWQHLASADRAVIVAVMDHGSMLDHEDLEDNLWRNPDETDNDLDDDPPPGGEVSYIDDLHGHAFYSEHCFRPCESSENCQSNCGPYDVSGHGTASAGVIVATADNDLGIIGLHFGAQLMSLRIYGGLGVFNDQGIGHAIRYAFDHGAEVLNLSLGMNFPDSNSHVMTTVGEVEEGLLIVYAAGNGPTHLTCPDGPDAEFDLFRVNKTSNMMFVMATQFYERSDPQVHKQSLSNYGKCVVDIAAPGQGVCSTRRTTAAEDTKRYSLTSHTSIAAPLVSGAVAILKSMEEFEACTPANIRRILMDYAHEVPVMAGENSDTNAAGGTVDLAFLADADLVREASVICTTSTPAAPIDVAVE